MKKNIMLIGLILLISNYCLGQHWVIFFAYPAREKTPAHDYSRAGHTYVSFVTRDQLKRQTVVDEIWGFHPVEQSLKAIFYVEKGKMLPESIAEAQYDFVVEVKDEGVYQNCKKIKDIWDKKNYSIVAGQTCVDYAKDVASKITNLDIPNEFNDKWPKDFLSNLRLKNSKTDQLGRKSLSEIPRVEATNNSLPPLSVLSSITTYLSPNNGFQFSYPKDWDFHENYEGAKVFLKQTNNANSKLNNASVAVFEIPITGTVDLGTIKSNISKNISYLRKPQLIKLEDRANNGYPGIYAEFTYKDFKYDMHDVSWFIYKNDRYYRIQYLSNTSFDNMYLAAALNMINSFTPLPSQGETAVKKDLKNLIGGSSPDELGEILLKALQTDNKELWDNCIHPDVDINNKFNAESFNRVKHFLGQEGITKWDLVEFSRVVYTAYNKGLNLVDFRLEFLYKSKEFIGALFIPSVKLYGKKYLIGNTAFDYSVKRK